jgi:hypothetical protein
MLENCSIPGRLGSARFFKKELNTDKKQFIRDFHIDGSLCGTQKD